MKFQITKTKIIFFATLFLLFNQNICFGSAKNKIENIIETIHSKNRAANILKGNITSQTIHLFDYDYFFLHSIPEIWKKKNSEQKQELKEKYNRHFVNKYFNDVLSCKDIEYSIFEKGNTIICSYSCPHSRDTRPKTIKFIKSPKSNDKISDISFNGISFLKNEGESVRNEYYNKR
jgi:hypothetical protein